LREVIFFAIFAEENNCYLMKIDKIIIGGYTNIQHVELTLNGLTALTAPNNYGKSNILAAVRFATDFISSSPSEKSEMMNFRPAISINSTIATMPFTFVMEGRLEHEGKEVVYDYGFSFEWAKSDSMDKGAKITEEHLRLKQVDDKRYTSYILRTRPDRTKHLATPKGRCVSPITILSNQLALNKMASYDSLFYVDVLKMLNNIQVKNVNTLIDPDSFFALSPQNDSVNGYSVNFPERSNAGFFIYSLKQLQPEKYELLKDAIMNLLDDVEDFEPIKVNIRKENETTVDKVPYQASDVLYDIRVKERFNNQHTSISRISSGSKRIIYVLALTLAGSINQIPLITFEELENSVHIRLLENLLEAVLQLSGETKILITSHSPYLVKYLSAENIYLGMPNSNGLADFRQLRAKKIKKAIRMASSEELTLGEYLFELMLDADGNSDWLNEYFEKA